ncbi:hypothetical protein GGH94_000537 [Coemansia aciculifera]|uniref:Extracellular membrane protein CFEM domain-containing protein n=1 Tax=Coemansia aciculifera TaxID=417176 RepID=A0A9W8IWH1_9FUNG|nr:hypothetical protein GGH94_000537 [Coemansia aciculifera]KAJ2876830.1 hypothetical protein GGH93_000423 [Coemansia aciculifera]
MKSAVGLAVFVLLASMCHGSCENPASFKKCLGQTRAEVNICGVNMTCKCLRQENVVRCYEKCGDDDYFKKLAQGEKGQQQIFCSQRRADEPEDMPIIGSDGPAISEHKKAPAVKQKKAVEPVKQAPAPPPPVQQQQDWDYRNNGGVVMRGGSGGTGDRDSGVGNGMVRNMDVEGTAAARAVVNAGAVAVSLLATVLFVF